MGRQPILSIALLASNRFGTIRRCLDSLTDLREKLPCELIILDTSTDPQVPPILAEYTDKVYKFTWVNDFSAARNETLKYATGEWYIYLDDDEWFINTDVLVDFIKSGEHKKYACVNYIQRNFHDVDLVHYSDSWASRMIRLVPETHFESKIHEYMVPVLGECKNLPLIANHTGYITVTPEDAKRRYERNSVLLREMIEEEPNRLRWRVQLVQEYNAMKMWDEMLDFCKECLELTEGWNERWDNRDIGTFYAGAVEGLTQKGNYSEAIKIAQKAFVDSRVSELCHGYLYQRLGVIGFRTLNWSLLQTAIDNYFLLKGELEKTPDKLANQEGALLVNEAYDAVPMKRAYSLLIAGGLKQGDTSALHQYLEKLEWNQKVIYVYEELIPVLIEAMATLPFEEIFVEVLQLMWNNKELQKKTLGFINDWAMKDADAHQKLLFVLAQIESEHWYVWYARVLVLGTELERISTGDGVSEDAGNISADIATCDDGNANATDFDVEVVLGDLEYALVGFFRNFAHVFAIPEEILTVIQKNGFSMGQLYCAVPFENWKAQIASYIREHDEAQLVALEKYIRGLDTENVRFDYFFCKVAEARVLYSACEIDYEKKRNALMNFAQITMGFMRKYYREHVFEECPEALPAYGLAALIIEDAFTFEAENPSEMLQRLSQVAVVYESFADAVKGTIQAYGRWQQEKTRREKEEFRNLKAQVLKQVQAMVDAKQYPQALTIVKQLQQMAPNDLELVTLALEIRLAAMEE